MFDSFKFLICYIDGRIVFDSDAGKVEIEAKGALDIAYALFDWAGKDYSELDEIQEKLEE